MQDWRELRSESGIPEEISSTDLTCPKCGQFLFGRPGVTKVVPVPSVLGYIGVSGVMVRYCSDKFHYKFDKDKRPLWVRSLKGIFDSMKSVLKRS